MQKRVQPLSVAEAAAAYDRMEVLWRQAEEWCRALESAFLAVLDDHTAVGVRLLAAIKPMLRGDRPTEDLDALWAEEKALRFQLRAVMACRRAAAKRNDAVYAALQEADRAHERAVARSRREVA